MTTKFTFSWIRLRGMEVNPHPYLSWKQAFPPVDYQFYKILVRKDCQEKYLGTDGLAKLTDETLARLPEGAVLLETTMKYVIVVLPRDPNKETTVSNKEKLPKIPDSAKGAPKK